MTNPSDHASYLTADPRAFVRPSRWGPVLVAIGWGIGTLIASSVLVFFFMVVIAVVGVDARLTAVEKILLSTLVGALATSGTLLWGALHGITGEFDPEAA